MKTYRAKCNQEGGAWCDEYDKGRHHMLFDLETNSYKILLRFLYRFEKPFYFHVLPFWRGQRGYTIFRIGRA